MVIIKQVIFFKAPKLLYYMLHPQHPQVILVSWPRVGNEGQHRTFINIKGSVESWAEGGP